MQPVAESESPLSPTTLGGQKAKSEQFASPLAYSPLLAAAGLGPPSGRSLGPPPTGPIRVVVSTEPTLSEVQMLLEELKARRVEVVADRKERDVEHREERDRAASQQNSIALLVSQGQQQAAAL